MRNLREARRDTKKVRAKKKVLTPSDNDYSAWYTRDVLEMEEKVKASGKSFFSQSCPSIKMSHVYF